MIKQIVTRPARTVTGFAGGFRYPLVAGLFIMRHPSLWPWCIVPVIINIIVLVLVWNWTGDYSAQLLASYVTDAAGWFWDWVRKGAGVVAFVGRVIVSLVAFVVVGTFAALPFNDLLSEKTDRLAGGWTDPRPFSLPRTVWELTVTGMQEGKRMTLFLMIIIPLFALSFIPVLAPFALVLKLIVTALFFTSDYLSYPMERRGALLFRHKFLIARRYFFPSLGFGMAVTCLALVPIVNFMFFPLAVVGGTLLFSDLVRQHGDNLRRGMPPRFNPYGPPVTPGHRPARQSQRRRSQGRIDAPAAPAIPPPPPPIVIDSPKN